MSITFSDLPYPADALEPYISERTLEIHHGKHHKAYVEKLNAAISGSPYDDLPVEEIILAAHEASETGVFNNAAQAWNHSFLWHSMAQNGGDEPTGPLADRIEECFNDQQGFRTAFKKAALEQFGSGWTWLVASAEGLDIVSTGNADTPLVHGVTPLLTLDVWEHAYYLDFQNKRDAYVDAFLNNLINWRFAEKNFEAYRVAA